MICLALLGALAVGTTGCVILPKDRALAKSILDTRGAIGEAAGAEHALTTVFDGKKAVTPAAKTELENGANELRYTNALFYLKAIPLLAAGESQTDNAAKAVQEARKHAVSANEHLKKAGEELRKQVK
ncbi:MAG: hypothetical protein HYW56_02580 [Candidatus Harrisonbacteria bacterium]|nr:hypothetical protein [Candidatus Harrisonbacteria bacterium]